MPHILVAGATVQCRHGGVVRLSGGDHRLAVSQNGALVSGDEVGVSFAPGSPGLVSPCNGKDAQNGPAPCSITQPAGGGTSALLAVGGKAVLLETAHGTATNPSVVTPPPPTWQVADPGQQLLSVAR